jgi:hypothetical protein
MSHAKTYASIKKQMDANGHVGGALDLSGTAITSLPGGLTVGGDLDLRGAAITSLPKGLTVGGDLYLSGTAITSLPGGLTVGGALDLRGTAITSLAEGLTVGGYLNLSGEQWTKVAFSDLQKFAAPWFAETLLVDDIGIVTGWCDDGIRAAMGALDLESDDDTTEYSRAEVHAALRKAAGGVHDDERTSIALAILDRVEAGK